MSNCSASCTSVRSPLIAAIATFALKADVWFRRGLLLMLSPDSRANLARCQAEAPLIALCRFPKPALTIDREKQYNGKINWDERNSTLIWEGRRWNNNNLTMKGVLRPVGTKKNLWRYDETQYHNGQKIGEYVWICEPVEPVSEPVERGDLK